MTERRNTLIPTYISITVIRSGMFYEFFSRSTCSRKRLVGKFIFIFDVPPTIRCLTIRVWDNIRPPVSISIRIGFLSIGESIGTEDIFHVFPRSDAGRGSRGRRRGWRWSTYAWWKRIRRCRECCRHAWRERWEFSTRVSKLSRDVIICWSS